MIKNNLVKISVCLLVIMALIFAIGKSFATDDKMDILNELTALNTNNDTIQQGNRSNTDEQNNTLGDTNTNNQLNKVNNANTNSNKPATTPYTGIENTPTVLFIILFAGSTIFAYKKIREYDA